MDFIDKKEKFADLIENYMNDSSKKDDLINYVQEIKKDLDFKDKELFLKLFDDVEKYLDSFSKKELKQRVLLVKSYLD
jgi:hypothetical protein